MQKHNYLLILLLIICSLADAQIRFRHGHKMHRIVSDKQYELKLDSANYAAEFLFSNNNTWTGDNYGYQPSLQFMLTYDNNKNFQLGVFGCFNINGFNGGFSNGADFFAVKKLAPRFTLIADAYTFLNRKDSLAATLGYKSAIYNYYTVRLKYDVTARYDLILGYSLLNNVDSLQQTVCLEVDYNVGSALVIAVQLNSGTHILNIKEMSFGAGVGLSGMIRSFKLGLSFNPLFQTAAAPAFYSPFVFVLSRDLSFQHHLFRKHLIVPEAH